MPAVSSKTEPRWERRKDARPAELTAAALEFFVERGYAATRLEDVAAHAGVSKGTLYLYFESKEEMLKAVVREGLLPVIAQGEEIFQSDKGPVIEQLRVVIDRWWVLAGSTRLGGLSKLMMAEARNFPEIAKFYHDEVISRSRALYIGLLQRGIDRGELRPMNVPAVVQAIHGAMLMRSCWAHSFCALDDHPVSNEVYFQELLLMIGQGLEKRKTRG